MPKIQNINKYDRNIKEIFKNKSLLSFFMKELIPDYRNIDKKIIEELIEFGDESMIYGSNTESFINNSNKIIYDLLITPRLPNSDEKIGMFINFEFQNTINYQVLENRSIRYAANLICQQVTNGKENKYLKDVYSIWICTSPKLKDRDTIYKCSLFNRKIFGNDNCDYQRELRKLNIFYLNVGGEYDIDEIKNSVLNVCDLLFERIPTVNANDIVSILNRKYDILINEEEVNKVASFEQAMRDLGYEEGMERGLKDGLKEGLKEGTEQATVSLIVSMIKSGIPKDKAFTIAAANNNIKKLVQENLDK